MDWHRDGKIKKNVSKVREKGQIKRERDRE